MFKLVGIFTFLVILTTKFDGGNSQCLTEKSDAEQSNPRSFNNLYRGQKAFTLNLLDAVNKATPNDNVIFSPYSTYHALLLAYFGAQNKTEHELSQALKLDWAKTKTEVFDAYTVELKKRQIRSRNSGVEFVAADKIFLSKQAELRDCMKDMFQNELEIMDFQSDYEKCRKDINEWVEMITKNEIKDILLPGDVTADTNLVLANAAYFKGQWASKFAPEDTKKEIFYSTGEEQIFVDMMTQKGTFNLGINEHLKVHILEMPYNGSDISMIILLPPFMAEGLDTLLSKLTTENLRQALNEVTPREIEVKLPKFSFEKTIELLPILNKIGVADLFQPTADLSGFSEKSQLQVGDARHKAKIRVDEEGSTASAATVLFTFRSARPTEPTTFICDHPFLFLIYDNGSDAILFSGIYRKPGK